MNTKKLILLISLLLTTSLIADTGTPSTLRVKTDANGYLLASAVSQTTPLTTSVFSNTRLKTDSNGYLLVTIGSGGNPFFDSLCLSSSTKNTVIKQVASNDLGIYTGATNCSGGTLRFDVSATAINGVLPLLITSSSNSSFRGGGFLGVGITSPTQLIHAFSSTTFARIKSESTSTPDSGGFIANGDVAGIVFLAQGSTASGTTFGGVAKANQAVFEAQNSSSFYIGTSSAAPIIFAQARVEKMRLDNTGNLTVTGTAAFGGLTASGTVGTPVIVSYGNVVAATNTGTASIATITPTVDTTYEVGCNILITTSTIHSFSCDATYTDEGNNSRTMVIPVVQLAGTFITTGLITNVTGTGPYESPVMTVRVKASTALTVRTSAGGTYTGVVYNARGIIKQVS